MSSRIPGSGPGQAPSLSKDEGTGCHLKYCGDYV
jgi:hypothetical protein